MVEKQRKQWKYGLLRRAKAWVEVGEIKSSFGIAMTVVGLESIGVVKTRHIACLPCTSFNFQSSPIGFFPLQSTLRFRDKAVHIT